MDTKSHNYFALDSLCLIDSSRPSFSPLIRKSGHLVGLPFLSGKFVNLFHCHYSGTNYFFTKDSLNILYNVFIQLLGPVCRTQGCLQRHAGPFLLVLGRLIQFWKIFCCSFHRFYSLTNFFFTSSSLNILYNVSITPTCPGPARRPFSPPERTASWATSFMYHSPFSTID